MSVVSLGNIKFGDKNPFVFISGPCVIEDEATTMAIAEQLKTLTTKLDIPFIFKASYDKANRTSIDSFRGPGIDLGMKVLSKIKSQFDVPVTSDVHTVEEIDVAKGVLDVLQIPAFLSRQTDLLIAAAKTNKIVNVKKGQFLAPADMKHAVAKVKSQDNDNVLLTERGASFGYNNLVTDFRSLQIMSELDCPVVLDASHSVQQPGGLGAASGGKREFIPLLARCGIAAGCAGLFMETHIDPSKALSDGPNMLPIDQLESMLVQLKAIDQVVKG